MSFDGSPENVSVHPAAAALEAILARVGRARAGECIDPQVVAAEAGVDSRLVEDQLLTLAASGVGRMEFQVLDEDQVPIPGAVYRRQSEIPKEVDDPFGNRVGVTRHNTRLVLRIGSGEEVRSGDAGGGSPRDPHKGNLRFAEKWRSLVDDLFDVQAFWRKVASFFLYLLVASAAFLIAVATLATVVDLPVDQELLQVLLPAVFSNMVSLSGLLIGHARSGKLLPPAPRKPPRPSNGAPQRRRDATAGDWAPPSGQGTGHSPWRIWARKAATTTRKPAR